VNPILPDDDFGIATGCGLVEDFVLAIESYGIHGVIIFPSLFASVILERN
jgi:hypothetical protein